MNKDFCSSCTSDDITPPCIITHIPSNPYLEDIIEQKDFVLTENLICHTYAQIYERNCLKINSNCDECGLCLAMCKNLLVSQNIDIQKLEKTIFEDISKICILLKRFCPSKTIATEVNTKGNSRNKRVDLCIYSNNQVVLIKLLKSYDKIPLYSRSYQEIIETYTALYPDRIFSQLILMPQKNIKKENNMEYNIIDLKDLLNKYGEIDVSFIK